MRRISFEGKVFDTYNRISFDPNQLAMGVGRQSIDTEARLKEFGATLGVVHVENDTSAYSKRKVTITDHYGNTYPVWRVIRPVLAEALQRLRRGDADGLMVDDLDRLARDPRDLEDAIEVVEHYGKIIVSASASEIDLSTPSGILSARVVVNMANKASADTARRVKNAARHRAMSGRPSMSGTRPFGWKEDRMTLDPVEAQLAREAVDLIIKGMPLKTIARKWNALGYRTPRGTEWDYDNVKTVLTRPRVAGYATIREEILRNAEGVPYRGQWEPLINEEKHAELLAVLKARAKPRRRKGKYLLGSTLVCGVCGSPMWGNVGQDEAVDGRSRKAFYSCKKGHNSINRDLLEDLVSVAVAQRYAKIYYFRQEHPEEFGILRDFPQALVKADLEERALSMMKDYYALENTPNRSTVGMEILAEVEKLRTRIADLDHEEALWRVEQSKLKGSDLPMGEFESLDFDTKRAYIEEYCSAIVIAKTYAGDPAVERRMSIQWSKIATPWSEGEEPSSLPHGAPDMVYSTYPDGQPKRLKGRGSRSPHLETARRLLAENPHVSSTAMMKASGLGRYHSQTLLAVARHEWEWGTPEDTLQVRKREKKDAVIELMVAHPEWSGRRIAKELGLSHAYANRLKKEATEEAEAAGMSVGEMRDEAEGRADAILP